MLILLRSLKAAHLLAKILYGVSPIGLGHASRAAAVGLKLREGGLEPVFATGRSAVRFLGSYGFKVHDIVTEPTPSERGGEMMYPALWYVRYWFGYRSTKSRIESLIDELGPNLIAGDEEFSCISVAIERGIKHALISDELELGFARSRFSRYLERKVAAWYTNLQRQASSLLVPDVGMDHGNVHFVSPVVRAVTRSREQVMTALGMEPDARMILFSASGSGIGSFLLDRLIEAVGKANLKGVVLVVSGLSGGPTREGVRYLGVVRDNQDFVAAADLVVSTAGKSTIDEATSYGSPIIAIPIKNHYEQERNASALGFSFEDLYHLDRLIPRYLGRRTEPRSYHGADSIAAYLQNLL
jgi:UDP-N-acetylglucosamine--N-acetylmuramyl-(pentapeptide) pyrophosphoryl-undecaprenol N-acetylglucosamine transferase